MNPDKTSMVRMDRPAGPATQNVRYGILTVGVLIVGLAMAISSSSASAGEGKGQHGRKDSSGWVERHADELGIDEVTLTEINVIVESSRAQGEAIYSEHRAARDAMRELLDQNEPDFEAVMQQAEVIGEIDIRKHKHRIATMLEIRAKLTPEQRSQLRELKKEMHGRHGKRGGCDRHHGGDRGRGDDSDSEAL